VKAWRVHGVGEPAEAFVLEDIPEPTSADLAGLGMGLGGWEPLAPGAAPFTDWVLLRMSAAGLALPDVTMARGTYPVPVGRPYVSGQEGVGVVIDAAPSKRHLLGKRVAAVTIQPFGSFAPVAVGVSTIFEVPETMSDIDAAGFLIPSHTGYHVVHRRGRVEEGEKVAVLGAAGGLGSAVVQLCVAAGAEVIAVVGGPEKAEFCLDLGAHHAVDHTAGDFVEGVRAATAGRGVDVVIDPVQGEMGERSRDMLVPDGRHVICGHASGLRPIDPHFYLRNHTLVGATLGGYSREEMARIHRSSHEAITRLFERGQYRPTTSRCVPFQGVPAALGELASRATMGRVVVTIDR
jgi:NADPH2:quinone reductase